MDGLEMTRDDLYFVTFGLVQMEARKVTDLELARLGWVKKTDGPTLREFAEANGYVKLDGIDVECVGVSSLIPVDLSRLREARAEYFDNNHERTLPAEYLADVGQAVLDAPTVRWCLEHGSVFWGGGHHGAVERCEWTTDERPPFDCRFGSAVVVPVKGANDAT